MAEYFIYILFFVSSTMIEYFGASMTCWKYNTLLFDTQCLVKKVDILQWHGSISYIAVSAFHMKLIFVQRKIGFFDAMNENAIAKAKHTWHQTRPAS